MRADIVASRWIFGLSFLFVLLSSVAFHSGCSSPSNPPKETTQADGSTFEGSPEASDNIALESPPPKIPPPLVPFEARLTTLSCPDKLASLATPVFTQTPCSSDGALGTCSETCTPQTLFRPDSLPGTELDAECKKTNVLCVGPLRSIQTLDQAQKIFETDLSIDKILLEVGTHEGTLSIDAIDRSLIIEGSSNDPRKGTVLASPKQDNPALDHATLQIKAIKSLTLRRFSLQGSGHGLWVGRANTLRIEGVIIEKNRFTGLSVETANDVQILRSIIRDNGGAWELRSKDSSQPNLFGIVLGSVKQTLVEGSEITRNAAGGLASGINPRAVGVTNDHRVDRYEKWGVGVTNDHRTTLRGNLIHRNGPVSANPGVTASASCSSGCKSGTFCEGGLCHSSLVETLEGKTTVLGVGTYIAGSATVEILETTFFRNDTSGLLLHSAKSVDVQRNHFEHNGARPFASVPELLRSALPAAHLWNLAETALVKHNVFSSNLEGLRVGQEVIERIPLAIARLTAQENLFFHQGRFLTGGEFPEGIGFRLASSSSQIALDAAISKNYFQGNGSSGFAATGHLRLDLKENFFRDQRLRAVTLQDLRSDRELLLASNRIEGAALYGIQVTDLSKTALLLSQNTIARIAAHPSTEEADGINLSRLEEGQIRITNNYLQESTRSGVFLDRCGVSFKDNVFEKNGEDIISQNDSKAEGMDAGVRVANKIAPLSNRKHPLP